MRRLIPLLAASLVVLGGCGGGPGAPSSTGGVAQAVGLFTAPYAVVELASGTLTTRTSIPDLTTNAAWRTTHMVFRRIGPLAGQVGAPGADLGTDLGDQPQGGASTGSGFLGVFEVTQAQWTALGGQASWLDPELRPAGGDAIGGDIPAFGISRSAALSACAAYSSGRSYRLALPSGAQWELACRAGSGGTLFSWGDAMDAATVRSYAAVFEVQAGQSGPRTADGSRLANAYGFYDLHGNVWEWIAELDGFGDGQICGGSWNDTVPLARCANRVALDPSVAHPLVGVRLALAP
jgi:formylglycine-generating enzyme required for sulfatase activity